MKLPKAMNSDQANHYIQTQVTAQGASESGVFETACCCRNRMGGSCSSLPVAKHQVSGLCPLRNLCQCDGECRAAQRFD